MNFDNSKGGELRNQLKSKRHRTNQNVIDSKD